MTVWWRFPWTELFIRDARRYLDALDPDEHMVAQPALDAVVWVAIQSGRVLLYADVYSELVSNSVNNVFAWARRRER